MKPHLLFAMAILFASACSQSDTGGREILSSDDFPGAGELTDAGGPPLVPDRVRSLCSPGTSQCVGENSPIIDRCADDGESLERTACPSGEVCRNRRCVPFACTPGTSLCIGNTRAQCDPTGIAVEETSECEGASVCEGGACVDLCEEAAETGSYIGCDYIAIRLPNLQDFGDPEDAEYFPFGIVLANSHPFATATVELTNGNQRTIDLWPRRDLTLADGSSEEIGSEVRFADGTTRSIESAGSVVVPPGGAAVVLPSYGTDLVRISSNRPVTAYQFSPYCCNSTYTNDASLLFPMSTWDTRYRAVGYPTFDNELMPYLALYSRFDQSITVETPYPLESTNGLVRGGQTLDVRGGEVTYLSVGNDTLASFEGSDEEPNLAGDLSGVELTGEEPLSVFFGHPCTFVPFEQWACDHLQEQLPPANTLGRSYLLTPVRRRARPPAEPGDEGVYWRITADEDSFVTFDPPLDELDLLPPANPYTRSCQTLLRDGEVALREGETCSFGTLAGVALSSTGDVTVAGVISGQASTGLENYGNAAGDPSIFILPAAAQFRESYAFVAPPTYARNFVSVASRAGDAVVLDGRNIEEDFRLQRQVVDRGGERWELFTVPIEPGLHTMSSDNPFGITVYAFDDYVSYAFVGGLDLLPKGAR